MKIDKEYFKSIDTSTDGKPKTSHFQDMLEKHLKEAHQKPPDSSPKTALLSKDPVTGEFVDLLSNIDKLKEVDGEYFEKASKKKTLAENFSSRFGATTEERLDKFKPLIESKAKKYGLDPNLLAGLLKQESNYNPYAVSHCGAMGLGQLMPETARSLGVKDPFNASQNVEGAAKYLRQMLDTFGGDKNKALAAYNAGPGAVKKYGGIPPYSETQNYVRAINSHTAYIVNQGHFSKAKA